MWCMVFPTHIKPFVHVLARVFAITKWRRLLNNQIFIVWNVFWIQLTCKCQRGKLIESASWCDKITSLTHKTQSLLWWSCPGRTGLWTHFLLSLAFACQQISKHPSCISIWLFFKFCLYAMLRKADDMGC